MNAELSELADRLHDLYVDLGLPTTSLSRYHMDAPPPERKSGEDDFLDDLDEVRDVNEYNHFKEFTETSI